MKYHLERCGEFLVSDKHIYCLFFSFSPPFPKNLSAASPSLSLYSFEMGEGGGGAVLISLIFMCVPAQAG